MNSIISLKNVYFSYSENENYILSDLNLEIFEGEFISIIGANGSGKSTLSKLFNSLLKPTKGEVKINGFKSSEQNLLNIRKSCGLVFQNPDNALVSSIVEDDVAFGPENIGLKSPEIKERVYEALKICSIFEFKDKDPEKLSGGQKQRVAIAGVLALRPKIIVFDEATSMLDPKGKEEIIKLMLNLNKSGTTIINITHNLEETLYSDRILLLDNGEAKSIKKPSQIYKNSELIKKYKIVPPFLYRVLNEIKDKISEAQYKKITKESMLEKLIKGIK